MVGYVYAGLSQHVPGPQLTPIGSSSLQGTFLTIARGRGIGRGTARRSYFSISGDYSTNHIPFCVGGATGGAGL